MALVAACILIICLIAAAFYFITKIVGGGRELQHATDSGTLNVAKQAILSPSTGLNNNDFGLALQGATQAPAGSNINMGQGVNLLTYNRLVGQALLVAMNASAEGNATGIKNAQDLIAEVEGNGANSIGSKLKAKLVANTWAQTYFNDTGVGNSLRMLGSSSSINYTPGDFSYSYLEQAPADTGATNVSLTAIMTASPLLGGDTLTPYKDYANFTKAPDPTGWSTSDNNVTYMRGYQGIQVANVGTVYGVPVQPGHQPHLVSQGGFAGSSNQPGGANYSLPPNGFRTGAVAREERSNTNVHMLATAIVGTPLQQFPISIPNGYLVISNAGSGPSNLSFTLPNTDNVAASELFTGITVDRSSGYFSNNGNVEAWQSADRTQPNWQNNLNTNGIYDAQGNPVSAAQAAANIPAQGSGTMCNDQNSAPGGDPQCNQLANNPVGPNGLDAFDQAYHPNGASNTGTASSQNLTAAEQAQCQVMNDYGATPHGGGPPMAWTRDFGPTGLRLYPNGRPPNASYPWSPPGKGFIGQNGGCSPGSDPGCANSFSDPNNVCKVTKDGTVVELFDQTRPGSGATVSKFITQRILEIKPTATQADIDKVLNQKLPLGKTYIAYMDAAGNIQMADSSSAPAWIGTLQQSATAKNPDGYAHGPGGDLPAATYDITATVANPQYSYGIHDVLFTQHGDNSGTFDNGNGQIKASDSATFTPSSGAYGLLGTVTLQETTQSSANLGFNSRD